MKSGILFDANLFGFLLKRDYPMDLNSLKMAGSVETGKKPESSPLSDNYQINLDKPKRGNFGVIFLIVSLIFIVIFLIGVFYSFWYRGTPSKEDVVENLSNKGNEIISNPLDQNFSRNLTGESLNKLENNPTPILPRIENPLARAGRNTGVFGMDGFGVDEAFSEITQRINLEVLEPKSPFLGQECHGDFFNGEGAICDKGQVRVNYFYRCDQLENSSTFESPDYQNNGEILSTLSSSNTNRILGNKCRTGSVCLAGVCTVVPTNTPEVYIRRHPFKLFRENSILSPNWWPLSDIQTLVQGVEPYQYYFVQIDSKSGLMKIWLGSDLLDSTMEPVEIIYRSQIIRLKSLCQIPDNLIKYLIANSQHQLSQTAESANYLGLSDEGELCWLEMTNNKQIIISPYKFIQRNSPILFSINEQVINDLQSSRDGGLLITSDQGSYLISSLSISSLEPTQNGESSKHSSPNQPTNQIKEGVILEKFEGSFICALQNRNVFALLLDNSLAYFHRSDSNKNSWSRYLRPGKFSSIAFPENSLSELHYENKITVIENQGTVVNWTLRITDRLNKKIESSESLDQSPNGSKDREKLIMWYRKSLSTIPARQLVKTWNELFILSLSQRISLPY